MVWLEGLIFQNFKNRWEEKMVRSSFEKPSVLVFVVKILSLSSYVYVSNIFERHKLRVFMSL